MGLEEYREKGRVRTSWSDSTAAKTTAAELRGGEQHDGLAIGDTDGKTATGVSGQGAAGDDVCDGLARSEATGRSSEGEAATARGATIVVNGDNLTASCAFAHDNGLGVGEDRAGFVGYITTIFGDSLFADSVEGLDQSVEVGIGVVA